MTSQRTLKIKIAILRSFVLFITVLGLLTVFAGSAMAQNPVPFIDQPLVPDAAAPGGPAFTLTVNGAGFVTTSVVNWNGSPLATTFVSSAQLTATVPASDIVTASSGWVTVVSPSPGGGASNTLYFSIAATEASTAFLPAATYGTGSTAVTCVAVADVNGDGKLDLIVANHRGGYGYYRSGAVAVLLGNGDGTFQRPVGKINSGGATPVSLAIADVNGDGKLDIVVANSGTVGTGRLWGIGTVAVLLGHGDGTFQFPVEYSSGGKWPQSVAIADVNGDGKLDLVVYNSNDGYESSVGVLLGNGDGTFQAAITFPSGGYEPGGLAVADLRGDGKLDLVVTDLNYGNDGIVGVLLGNGDSTFQPAVWYDAGGTSTSNVALADVNGDGKPDILTVNGDGSVGVLLGNGDGTFRAAVSYAAGNTPFSIAVADVNGDGTQDAVTANWDGGADVLLGNGDGTFQAAQLYSGNGADAVAVADLTGDGLPDIVLADTTWHGSVSVLLNNSGPHSPTTTALTSSKNPQGVKQDVTYTATVASQSGTATGTVTFQDGGATIATVALSNNHAAYATYYKTIGIHSITATYSGDQNNAGSTSPTLTEDIDGKTETVVTTSGSPSMVGQPVTFTATVTSIYGTIPDGELVTFYDRKTEIGTGTTASGVATFTTSSLKAGKHYIKATYAGDAAFKPSSGEVIQVVEE